MSIMERGGTAWRLQKPYKGTSGVMSDLVGNHVSAMFVPTHLALPLAADRQIRILGVASYLALLLSTAYLVLAGYAAPSVSLALAAVLVAGGGLLAAKDMIVRKR